MTDSILYDLLGWLHLLPSLAGAIVCGLPLRRSPWVAVMMGGFGFEALVSVFYRVVSMTMKSGMTSPTSLGFLYMGASVVGLAASVAVVAGLAGLLYSLAYPS